MRLRVLLLSLFTLLLTTAAASADTFAKTIRDFTVRHAPAASEAQAREFGLFLPDKIDVSKPMIVLVHGLDMDTGDWNAITKLLQDAGQQVALFGYPQDQAISDDVQLLTDRIALLHRDQPKLKLDLVAFSMGSLICRAYVEGDKYGGEVDRMILLCPPNHGSNWAKYAVFLKCREQLHLALTDDNWNPSWFITSGLCEADWDLSPGSKFLTKLNAKPRRASVRYTIVEGDQHVVRRMTADCIAAPVRWVPDCASHWWGFRQTISELTTLALTINSECDCGDGPVQLTSAELSGVSDVVRIHADHSTMIQPHHGEKPKAWPVIEDRLGLTH